MSDVKYTDPALVTDVKVTDTPNWGRTASGYGGQIPTRYMIRYRRHWHRVYMMQYSNSGSAYIHSLGQDLFLDLDTEHRLTDERDRASDPRKDAS